MAPTITNPFSITYGTFQVGGNTDYQLVGPYVIDKTHDEFRLVFEVIIAGTSYSNLQTLSNNLEAAFRARLLGGQTLIINLSGSSWTYTMGTNLLKATAQIGKTGKPETDRGYSRSYTITITGQLPADQTSGLRDIEVIAQKASNRQTIVSMRGTYTANSGTSALGLYSTGFDAEANTYLSAIKGSATWELVDESFALDREKSGASPFPHLCVFTRQYAELLFNQSLAALNDTQIRDHRVNFVNMAQLPGDSKQGIRRLQRVVGSYDCSVDVDQTTDLHSVYANKIRALIKQTFVTNFSPTVFALEEERVGFDETGNRISATLQFVFQPSGSEPVVEVMQSVAFRETRQIDYTPVHLQDELAANADVGFAMLERIWTRVAVVVGDQRPMLRIAGRPNAGNAGLIESMAGQTSPDSGSSSISASGWNVVNSTSEVRPLWIGTDQNDFTQFQLTTLTETVTERYHNAPQVGTSAQIPTGPTTGGRGGNYGVDLRGGVTRT